MTRVTRFAARDPGPAQERAEERHEPRRRGDVEIDRARHLARVGMIERCEGRRVDRRMHPEIEPPPAIEDRPRKPARRPLIGQIERRERRRPAKRADAVIKLLEAALGARDREHMPAATGKRARKRGAA